MYTEFLRVGMHGQKFDIRGVRKTEETRDLSNRKQQSSELQLLKRKLIRHIGRDKDGAFRALKRIDGKA